MRLKSEIWVKGYIRRCEVQLVSAFVVRRGQRDAGAIYVRINRLDGTSLIFGPAPAGLDGGAEDRFWSPCLEGAAVSDADADAYLARQAEFDSDLWVIEIEDPDGRHFLGEALVDP